MRKSIVIPLAVFLAACGGAATVTNNALGAQARGKQTAAQPADWSGSYSGGDAGAVMARITPRGGNRYHVEMETIEPSTSCGGTISGEAIATGNRLTFSDSMPSGGEGNASCTMTLTRQGNRLSIGASGDCHYWSGVSCGFNGTLRRDGPPPRPSARGRVITDAAPVRAAPASGLAGAWAFDRSDCEAVAQLTLRPDGSFYTQDEAGRWRSMGATLTLTTNETFVEGGDSTRLRTPRVTSFQVSGLTANGMRLHAPNGRVSNFLRCPS